MNPALPRIQKEMAYVLGDHAIRSAYQLALTNSISKIKTFYNQVLLQYNIVLLFFPLQNNTVLLQNDSHSTIISLCCPEKAQFSILCRYIQNREFRLDQPPGRRSHLHSFYIRIDSDSVNALKSILKMALRYIKLPG